MEHFSQRCHCARAAASLCCLCSCSRFPFPRCWAWSPAPPAFSRVRARRTSTSYCFLPTMWCLLLLVSPCLTRCCKRNEKGLPYPCGSDGVLPRLRFLSGHVGRADGRPAGRRLSHHLLPRAFGVDGLPAVLHQLHCIGAIPGECETVDAARCKVDCDCGRDSWLHRAFHPASTTAVAQWDVSEFSGDDGPDYRWTLFPHREVFPGTST